MEWADEEEARHQWRTAIGRGWEQSAHPQQQAMSNRGGARVRVGSGAGKGQAGSHRGVGWGGSVHVAGEVACWTGAAGGRRSGARGWKSGDWEWHGVERAQLPKVRGTCIKCQLIQISLHPLSCGLSSTWEEDHAV